MEGRSLRDTSERGRGRFGAGALTREARLFTMSSRLGERAHDRQNKQMLANVDNLNRFQSRLQSFLVLNLGHCDRRRC